MTAVNEHPTAYGLNVNGNEIVVNMSEGEAGRDRLIILALPHILTMVKESDETIGIGFLYGCTKCGVSEQVSEEIDLREFAGARASSATDLDVAFLVTRTFATTIYEAAAEKEAEAEEIDALRAILDSGTATDEEKETASMLLVAVAMGMPLDAAKEMMAADADAELEDIYMEIAALEAELDTILTSLTELRDGDGGTEELTW